MHFKLLDRSACEQSLVISKFIGLEWYVWLVRRVKDLFTGFYCSKATPINFTSPIQELQSVLNRVNITYTFPLLHLFFEHREKTVYKLPLSLYFLTQRYHTSTRKHIFIDPNSNCPALHENHCWCGSKKAVDTSECCKTLEYFE